MSVSSDLFSAKQVSHEMIGLGRCWWSRKRDVCNHNVKVGLGLFQAQGGGDFYVWTNMINTMDLAVVLAQCYLLRSWCHTAVVPKGPSISNCWLSDINISLPRFCQLKNATKRKQKYDQWLRKWRRMVELYDDLLCCHKGLQRRNRENQISASITAVFCLPYWRISNNSFLCFRAGGFVLSD